MTPATAPTRVTRRPGVGTSAAARDPTTDKP